MHSEMFKMILQAIAHYKHAYDALASMKHPLGRYGFFSFSLDASLGRIHEFKSIAEILTFKVIQLQLASGEVPLH